MPLRRLAILLLAVALQARGASHRRALLIGINDYTASRISGAANASGRSWPNLSGAANDARALQELLTVLHGFAPRDIVTLTDQNATRNAVLEATARLAAQSGKDDVVLFYFAGHGSQVRNSRSDEPDRLDETLVPADSRRGVRDIRDKELRPLFNRILDRGARLTIMLDNCHSASGARGLPNGMEPRGVKPDLRDIADPTDYGPRPDDRGALVIAAAQDFDEAWETRGLDGAMHGAFTWAWMRALRDAAADEPVIDVFLRAQARLRNEKPFQEPAIEGTDEAKRLPFLGTRSDRRGDRTVVAVKSRRADGTVVVLGGWAHGLTAGSRLKAGNTQLVVTRIAGLGESEARVVEGTAPESGALLEVSGWAVSPSTPLRVWIPRVDRSIETIAGSAKRLAAAASKRGARWISDPVSETAAHVILAYDAGALATVQKLAAGDTLFVQFPAPANLVDPSSDGVEVTTRRSEADYILTGRWTGQRIEYAWVRPLMNSNDARKSGLPVRTKWLAPDGHALRRSLLQLRRIHAWQTLESPPSPFHLALSSASPTLVGGKEYRLFLQTASRVSRRYIYVFVVDNEGRSTLLFPRNGSVENRFPIDLPAPPAIPIGDPFVVAPPYGIDTYYLLSADEALPDPSILEWDAVRAGAASRTPLEELLILTATGARGRNIFIPAGWSLEKTSYESVSSSGS